MVKCDKCWHEGMGCNTGEMQQDGYLNCMCGTAAMRHKFNQAITAWVKDVPMTQGDLLWAVCQRAVEQERAKTGWEPIATAPRDGTLILLGSEVSAISTAGRWQIGWGDAPDEMGCDDGWVDCDYQVFYPPRTMGAEAYRHKGIQPTHWMQLPKAPS